jgi:hypothetical protein
MVNPEKRKIYPVEIMKNEEYKVKKPKNFLC